MISSSSLTSSKALWMQSCHSWWLDPRLLQQFEGANSWEIRREAFSFARSCSLLCSYPSTGGDSDRSRCDSGVGPDLLLLHDAMACSALLGVGPGRQQAHVCEQRFFLPEQSGEHSKQSRKTNDARHPHCFVPDWGAAWCVCTNGLWFLGFYAVSAYELFYSTIAAMWWRAQARPLRLMKRLTCIGLKELLAERERNCAS